MKRTIISPEVKRRVELNGSSSPESGDSPEHLARIEKVRARSQFSSLAEQIAKSTVYELNYKIPQAEKHYPIDIDSRFVSKFFPYASGGPLYVDEPQTEAQMLKAYEKQKLLKKCGYRSLVIEKNDEYKDLQTAYYDCLVQLGEI